jgi:osmotically-inducible protein OsmY
MFQSTRSRVVESERNDPRRRRDERCMQPVGRYPIHTIVKNGRVMLLGVVDNATDRQLADVRVREVTGVFEVENGLTVAGSEK